MLSDSGSNDPWSTLRVAAAGAWHNLIFWAIILAAASLGIGKLFLSGLWKDVSHFGNVVVDVDEVSRLQIFVEWLLIAL